MVEPLNIWITIGSSLVSGLIGVGVSFFFFSRMEFRKLKIDTARRLLGNRFNIGSHEFLQALNEVFVVFAKNKKVIKALNDFWDQRSENPNPSSSDVANDRLITLMKAIVEDVGLKQDEVNDSFYLKFLHVPHGHTRSRSGSGT